MVQGPNKSVFDEFRLGFGVPRTSFTEGFWAAQAACPRMEARFEMTGNNSVPFIRVDALWRGSIVARTASASGRISAGDTVAERRGHRLALRVPWLGCLRVTAGQEGDETGRPSAVSDCRYLPAGAAELWAAPPDETELEGTIRKFLRLGQRTASICGRGSGAQPDLDCSHRQASTGSRMGAALPETERVTNGKTVMAITASANLGVQTAGAPQFAVARPNSRNISHSNRRAIREGAALCRLL